jgi:hypothetical protein
MADPITVKITNLNSPIATVKVSNKVAESAVTSVAGRVGDILLTQSDVAGLENVNNTSDLNKPISTATQAAIDAINVSGDYAPLIHQHIVSDITDLADGPISLTNKTLTDSSNVIHADQLHFRVKADEPLLKGQPVKYDSFNVGQNAINVSLSNQLTDVTIGLAEENIPQGSFGNIITAGVLDHTDTRDFNEGEILYVDGLGQLTGVEPTSGYSQPIAICLKSQQNNGSLQVLASYPKQPSTDVRNDSNVSGLNVTEALNNLNTSIQSIDIDSFSITGHEHFVSDITDLFTGEFSQTGHNHVVADITDLNTGAFAVTGHSHSASDITNDSAIIGATVKDALDAIEAGGIGGGDAETAETSIYIDAAAFLAKDGEADASTGADNGTNNSVDWYNVATAETLYAKVAMPPQWDGGTINAEIFWTVDGGTVGENVKWEVAAQAGGNDDAWDVAFPVPTATLDDPILANGDIHRISAESITVGGSPQDGDILHFEVARATAGATAASQDARLLGVRIIYSNSLLQNWYSWKLGNETADASTGVKVTWYAPANGKIHGVAAGSTTATSGSSLVSDVHKNGTTIFDTKITIDASESSTATAATPAVLTNEPTSFSAGDKFEFEVDTTTAGAAGLHTDLLISWD